MFYLHFTSCDPILTQLNNPITTRMPRKVSFSETQLPNFDKPIRPPSISVDFSTTVPECPVTAARQPARYTNDYIEKPGVPRANTTASIDRPDGDESYTKQFGDFVCPRSKKHLDQ